MTKAELIDLICNKNDAITKKAGAELVDTIFDTLQTAIRKDEKFSYPGFGTFTVRTRKARTGIDPRTKAPIQIPASRTVGFKPAKAFKETL
jgi:DNA-binding protein HU-beta